MPPKFGDNKNFTRTSGHKKTGNNIIPGLYVVNNKLIAPRYFPYPPAFLGS